MKMRKLLLYILFLPFILSCQKSHFTASRQENLLQDKKTSLLNGSDNEFGLELFRRISAESKEDNLMLSPLSISMALAMTYNGAEAETKTEMEKVLNVNGLSKEQINGAHQQLLSTLQSLDEEVTFEIANALYYSGKFDIKSEFTDNIGSIYDTRIAPLDFASPASVEEINTWVKEKTRGRITEIINQLSPLDRMVLLNANYFYGTWSNLFDEDGTKELTFEKSDNIRLKIPMMSKLEQLPYIAMDNYKAIQMPYGNRQFNMVVLLPADGHNTKTIIKSLTQESWQNLLNAFRLTDRVRVTMPRYKFAYETSLNEVLATLGMEKAFLPREANFSGISDDELYINEIRHKTFIDVNETGTEAAAVTGAVFATTSFREEPPEVPFFVNKPFIFAITEKDSGAILFIGEVNHPEYKQ